MKSKYQSSKSVAKNPTVPISADDPRVAWNKVSQTKSRQGAEIDIVGLNGKSLIAGGTSANNASGATSTAQSSGTKATTYVPPSNGKPGFNIEDYSLVPTPATDLVASWDGDNLVINFNWDHANDQNKSVSEFVVELTGEGVTVKSSLGTFPVNDTQNAQTVTVTKLINEQMFGNFTVDLSAICIYVTDPFYNYSIKSCAAIVPEYILDLPVPEITVTAITSGYNVAYTIPTQSIYDAIEIVEYESNSSTEPTGVTYTTTYWNSINPAIVIAQNTNPRWVKARFSSHARIFTDYCAAQKVTPNSPVSLDNTPPNEVTSVTAVWSGDNINLSYVLPSTQPAARVQIQLTAPNNLVGYFYRFPINAGTNQTDVISKSDLFNQFGEHYSSFTGVLKSIDSADNKSAGVSFTVAQRANPLSGITPTFTTVPLSNGYSVNYTLPTGAVLAEVYAKHTPWSGDPLNDNDVIYAGKSPAVIVDTDYTTAYIKIRYYDDFQNTSNYSAEGTATPLNPGEITSFENPITFGENAVIYAGNSPTTGTRTLFKTGGIFAYDATNSSPSTQIVSNASAGTPTFITTQAQIADWKISQYKIENDLSGTPSNYTGLSASGTYSFWAGSSTSGGNSSAKFTVTPAGAVTAREMYIVGTGDANSKLIDAGGAFYVKHDGSVYASSAEITGKITAASGSFTGNVSIGASGSIYSGVPSGNGISGAGFVLNSTGIKFNSSSVSDITTINGSTGEFITTSALIGGWTVSSSEISKTTSGQGKIKLDSANGYISISNTSDSSKLAGINAASGANNSVFWSGGTDPDSTSNPFRVTFAGKLYTKSGQIGGSTNYWSIDEEGIASNNGARIKIGNYQFEASNTTEFQLAYVDPSTSAKSSVILTDTIAGYARIYLGQTGRQVEVAKNAEISGSYSGSDQDYRSGGLRNMYTITTSQYASNTNAYPDAGTGSVLLVYTP